MNVNKLAKIEINWQNKSLIQVYNITFIKFTFNNSISTFINTRANDGFTSGSTF